MKKRWWNWRVRARWWWKEQVLNLVVHAMAVNFKFIKLVDPSNDCVATGAVADAMYEVYWWVESRLARCFALAYAGSLTEIEDAIEWVDWENAQAWMNDFQRLVAAGRILPITV